MATSVLTKFDPGREWVMKITKVPARAGSIMDCDTSFVTIRHGSAMLEVGSVLVESLRNDKGVQATIVLPCGYSFPTGRMAPKETWFQMMKPHLRSWLAMTVPGRIVRLVNDGLRAIEAQRAAGLLSQDDYEKTVAKMESFRTEALGELPTEVSTKDLLAGFYNWVTEAASQSRLTQQEIVAIIDRALRNGTTVPVPDLEEDVLDRDFKRFLDI